MVEKVASRGFAAPARCQSLALRAAILGPGRALPAARARTAPVTASDSVGDAATQLASRACRGPIDENSHLSLFRFIFSPAGLA